ncbi:MAG TPA: 16S rRNA (cytidine(1402)-2'-O)-methyltransferase [bacterium]|nr:16S rRNA (cytidine(1402)-2'-O)-methyltransferase [bacterium]
MPGTLYIVATPIGNLEDITFRAVRILKECDLIACEDTRHTRKLLNHFGIETPTTSYFEHNKFSKGDHLIRQLQEGKSVALVSDAGTPGVSDPGYNLVVGAVEKGIPVVPVPGPSAAISALCASGLPTDRFLFIGFLPQKDGKKRKVLESLVDQSSTLIFYESPFRVKKTLILIKEVFGEDRRVVLAHELTKVHEGFFRGTVGELIGAELIDKGEWILLVEGSRES